jgi:hypothetical protein
MNAIATPVSSLANLDAATLTALAKVVGEAASAARDNLAVGDHAVDSRVTIDVAGLVRVGADFDQRIVAKADPWLLLGVALSHLNGVTVESIVEEALNTELSGKDIKAKADAAIAAVKAPTVTACKGKVTTKVTGSVVA